jgi:hypothetical protein
MVDEGKPRLRLYCKYGWNFQSYLSTPRNALELNEWRNFVREFKTLIEIIQELTKKKLHGGTKVWCIQHRTIIIDAT